MIKIIDIIFWVLIAAVIGVAIWMLVGSPPLENGLLMIVIFIATSEILLWKAFFSIEKKTEAGFIRMKNDINNKHKEIFYQLNEINSKLNKKR